MNAPGGGEEGGPVIEWIEGAGDEAGRSETAAGLAGQTHATAEESVSQERGIGEHVPSIHHPYDRP